MRILTLSFLLISLTTGCSGSDEEKTNVDTDTGSMDQEGADDEVDTDDDVDADDERTRARALLFAELRFLHEHLLDCVGTEG